MAVVMDESTPAMPAVGDTPQISRAVAPALTADLCPYCGTRLETDAERARCPACKGLLDPLSRQASQNAMGPWAMRDEARPFNPGCSYDTLKALVARGRIRRDTIIRGPTTRQFWMFAANVPGVAVLLGECHACHHAVQPDEFLCARCGVALSPPTDRQTLGLAPVRLLPGGASAPAIAASAVRPLAPYPPSTPTMPGPIETPPQLRRAAPLSFPVSADPSATSGLSIEDALEAESAAAALARRRQRDRVHTITVTLIVAVAAMTALALLLAIMALRKDSASPPEKGPTESVAAPPTIAPPAPSPASSEAEAAPPADATPASPLAMVSGVPVDAGLEPWHERIAEAAILETSDSPEDVRRAIDLLEAVVAEASEASPAGTGFPIIQARIAALRERLDDLVQP